MVDISFGALFYFSWLSLSVVIQTSIASLSVPDITSLHLEDKKRGLCQGILGKIPHPIWTESNLKKISIASNCLKTAGRNFLRRWTKTNSHYGQLSHWLCKQFTKPVGKLHESSHRKIVVHFSMNDFEADMHLLLEDGPNTVTLLSFMLTTIKTQAIWSDNSLVIKPDGAQKMSSSSGKNIIF